MIVEARSSLGSCIQCGKPMSNDGDVAVRFRFRKEGGEQVPDGVEFRHQDCVDEDWRWSSHEEFETNDEANEDDAVADPDSEDDETKAPLEDFLTLEIEFLSRQIEERFKLKALISVQEDDLECAKFELEDEQDENQDTSETEAEIAELTAFIEQNRTRLMDLGMIIRHGKHWTSAMREHEDDLEAFYEDDDLIDWRPLEMNIRAKHSAQSEIEVEEAELAEIETAGKSSRKAQRIRMGLATARAKLTEIEVGLLEQKVQLRDDLESTL